MRRYPDVAGEQVAAAEAKLQALKMAWENLKTPESTAILAEAAKVLDFQVVELEGVCHTVAGEQVAAAEANLQALKMAWANLYEPGSATILAEAAKVLGFQVAELEGVCYTVAGHGIALQFRGEPFWGGGNTILASSPLLAALATPIQVSNIFCFEKKEFEACADGVNEWQQKCLQVDSVEEFQQLLSELQQSGMAFVHTAPGGDGTSLIEVRGIITIMAKTEADWLRHALLLFYAFGMPRLRKEA